MITPYQGVLVDLSASAETAYLHERASKLNSIQLSPREICDLELLATGAFSPLDRFVGNVDLRSILGEMRLANGTFFPVPISLHIDREVGIGNEIALRDSRNDLLAIMAVEEVFEWNRRDYLNGVAGTEDSHHPLVAESQRWGRFMVSGRLEVISLPGHYDFPTLRRSPTQTRADLESMGGGTVVAFQTRNPIHRAHEAVMRAAVERTDGVLLIHPTVGVTKPGDIDQFTRVRSYEAILRGYFDPTRTLLAVLPLAMRMAGPREALWHMIIRRNYGASHFLVGRDHASPGVDSTGKPFYGATEAAELAEKYSSEIGVNVLGFEEMVYDAQEDIYVERSEIPAGRSFMSLSGTQVRDDYLAKGIELPSWFTRPEVASLLRSAFPPRREQGFCIWFTGLSGAGKSTIADVLELMLLARGKRVTLLDGDVVRLNLSKGLGFSREDRDTNIRRIGFVAAEIVRHSGAAICAAISPYRDVRAEVRAMFPEFAFVEVYVNTPFDVCEQRDTKGLYAQARRGEITGFTGLDDPYETPLAADIVIDTVNCNAADGAGSIIAELQKRGFLD